MVEAGRDLWRSSGPASLLKQGDLEQAAQDNVQEAFEVAFEYRDSTASLVKLSWSLLH